MLNFLLKQLTKTSRFILMVSLTLSSAYAYSGALEEVPNNEKRIGVRAAQNSEFSVKLKTAQSSYKVNEAISFKVKGSHTFYLYLFNHIKSSNQAVAILPNKYQTSKNIKYKANQWQKVLNKKLEFYSDRAGKERIIMVASKKYLDVNKLLKKTRSKGIGDFYLMDDPMQAVEALINNTYQLATSKRIGVRSSSGSRLPNGVVIKELYLKIK